MNDIHIAENVGDGLFAFLLLEHPHSYLQLRLKKVEVVHNFLVQDNSYCIGIVQYVQVTAGGVYSYLPRIS